MVLKYHYTLEKHALSRAVQEGSSPFDWQYFFFSFIIHFSSIFFKKFKNAIIIVKMNKRYGQLKSFTSYLKKKIFSVIPIL